MSSLNNLMLDQSKSPPMSIPSSYSAGGGGGVSLAGLAASFPFFGASWAATGASEEAPPPTPPKNSVTDLPLRALATAWTKTLGADKLAALSTALIESAVIYAPWAERTKAAYETACCSF